MVKNLPCTMLYALKKPNNESCKLISSIISPLRINQTLFSCKWSNGVVWNFMKIHPIVEDEVPGKMCGGEVDFLYSAPKLYTGNIYKKQ